MSIGFAQAGLVVLGGATMTAGAVVIGTLWVRRRHRLNGFGPGSEPGPDDGSGLDA